MSSEMALGSSSAQKCSRERAHAEQEVSRATSVPDSALVQGAPRRLCRRCTGPSGRRLILRRTTGFFLYFFLQTG
jgi:hypothetical protein